MTAIPFNIYAMALPSLSVLFLDQGSLDCKITPLKNGMTVHLNKHLSLLSFRLAFLSILSTLSSLALQSLHISSNLAIRMSSAIPNHLVVPLTAHLSFSDTYLQIILHQMVVIYICTYQTDKRKL